jgi:hypothetical protein
MLLCLCTLAFGQETKSAAELGLAGFAPETRVLILRSDPTAVPVEPVDVAPAGAARSLEPDPRSNLLGGPVSPHTDIARDGGTRLGCADEGFTIYPYAVSDPLSLNYIWLSGNTMYGDDLTLEPGTWQVECYDVFIYADNAASYGCNRNRTVTLRAHTSCNGAVIPGSQESWTVPPHGGPILLTGVTNVSFAASGTIWFSMTTSINKCDGWYVSDQNLAGSTTIYIQQGTNCQQTFTDPQYNKFHVVLYALCASPSFTVQPAGGAICPGASRQICVTAAGSAPLSYQWRLGGVNITGATSSCYSASQAGSYTCVVTNTCGSATSNAAVITASTPVTITSQPADAGICSGQTHQFCVTAAGSAPLSYQWQLNEVNISGATSSCYTASQAGSYRCNVTNTCGSAMSSAAALSLSTPPSITTQPVDASICSGQTHQFCITAGGAPPLSCQWQLNQVDITGATGACYTASQAGSYRCIVSNSCGPTPSNSATLTLLGGPTITSEPAGGAVCGSQPYELCVTATGNGMLRYQWKRNNLTIIGATLSCYSATRAAAYTCVVTDDCGPTLSAAATVVVLGTGDLNGDTYCNLGDVQLFVEVLLGIDTDPAHHSAADMTCDGAVDARDIQVFVNRCIGG